MSKPEFVVLVDEQDGQTGTMEKLQAHVEGRLHRAISVFIFNSKNELLLQQRADGKYHSAGLWTNTCCSHPRPGEDTHSAAVRRLEEEMSITCALTKVFDFVYKAPFANGLTEYEYDHVYKGSCDDVPVPDDNEVGSWKYVTQAQLTAEMSDSPDRFTEWFKICINDYGDKIFG